MTDFDLILHERIRQNGSEYIVRTMLGAEKYIADMIVDYEHWGFEKMTDSEIRFEASRCAYRLKQRHK